MDLKAKIEIEINCNKIINQIHQVKKNSNFSSVIIDDQIDIILCSVNKIIDLVQPERKEYYGYDLKQGKIVKVNHEE
jgi:hypothetical protein